MAPSINITLHFLNRSRAQRIIWLLEELNLKYQLKTYTRLPDQQAPASLKSIHPLGKSPVLEIDQPGRWKKPLVLAESANIVEYVTEHFGRHLIPERWKEGEEESKSSGSGSGSRLESEVESGVLREETLEWARYRFYMHYSEGSLMNLIGSGALKNGIKQAPVPFFIKPITKKIGGLIESSYLNHNNETHLTFLESEFASCQSTSSTPTFICGSKLTAADFMMAFPLEAAQQIAGLTEERYPLLTGYVRRVKEREAYRRAVERIIQETGVFEEGI